LEVYDRAQPGATYLEMFEWNARQLAAALQP